MTDAAGAWHDAYTLFGEASATMIGLLFVAASVGSGFFTKDRYGALRAFLSPSVVHFTCVLAASLIAISPLRSGVLFGVLIGTVGLYGFGYAIFIWRFIFRQGLAASIGLEDRSLYAACPAVAHGVMMAAGVTLTQAQQAGCDLLAAAMGLLVLVSIRNAWDMTVWTVVHRPD